MATERKQGLNPQMYLVAGCLDPKAVSRIPTRDGYGEGLVEAGTSDPNVVVLCADLSESTRCLSFKQAFPDRFVQLGVSEQSLASIGAGMALAGKTPFISSYAAFSPGRNWEQIKTTVALNDVNVKIAGAHAGVSVGPDGATHQMLEDVALMRVLPNMRVIVPCDSLETKKATVAAARSEGPAYLRFAREKSPVFTTAKTPFAIGRADVFRFGTDLTLIASGPLLYETLLAAETLSQKHGIEARVLNCHSVKPLDLKAIVAAAKETGTIVTVEEAQAAGGLGGAVCEALALTVPVPVERIGMQDRYGESGEPVQLTDVFGLTAPYVVMAAKRAWKRKQGQKVPEARDYVERAKERLEEERARVIAAALTDGPAKKRWKK